MNLEGLIDSGTQTSLEALMITDAVPATLRHGIVTPVVSELALIAVLRVAGGCFRPGPGSLHDPLA